MNHILKHIIKSIESSSLIDEPFGHKFVKNIFPKEYYQALLVNLPSKSNFIPITETGTVSGNYSSERFVFNLLEKENIKKLNQEKKLFWNQLLENLLSKQLFESVNSMFNEIIINRIKNFSNIEKEKIGTSNFKISMRVMLIKDFTKYNLGAHTDGIGKLISFLFYIPSSENLSNIGTSLYKPIYKIDVNEIGHYTLEETKNRFKKVKTCPFIPNSLFLFPRTHLSFHGVEEINIHQEERNLLLLNYYINKSN